MQMQRAGSVRALVLLALAASSASAQWDGRDPLPAPALPAGAHLGASAAIWGDRLVVGAPGYTDSEGRAVGAAFVYERVNRFWTGPTVLLAPGGADGDEFGRSVAMCCDTMIVGAPGADLVGENTGSVYVYTHSGPGLWELYTVIQHQNPVGCERFGWSCSLSSDVAVVGAWSDDPFCEGNEAAFVFEFIHGEWLERARFEGQFRDGSEEYAYSVATSDRRVLVGAWGNDAAGPDSGVVYAYEENQDLEWTLTGVLGPDQGIVGSRFGSSLAASGEFAAVGAPGDSHNGSDSGAAYVYEHEQGAWSEQARLAASDAEPGDLFGAALDLTGTWTMVGAPGAIGDSGNIGAAYFFQREGSSWLLRDVHGRDATQALGTSIAISGGEAVAGDPLDDAQGADAGAAHPFQTCYADFDRDGSLDTKDFLAFLNAWVADDDSADCDGCGIVDTRDFTCFFFLWNSGCE